jgi:predicted GNAT family acetyltransferase
MFVRDNAFWHYPFFYFKTMLKYIYRYKEAFMADNCNIITLYKFRDGESIDDVANNLVYKLDNNSFKATYKDSFVAYLEFELDKNIMTITHTIVDSKFGGRGIAKALLDLAIDLAKKNNYKINPVCSYANHVLHKDDKYIDLLV